MDMEEQIKTIRVCFLTAFPPSKKGEAEYAYEYVKAFLSNYPLEVKFYVITEQTRRTDDVAISLPTNPSLKVERVFKSSTFTGRAVAVFKIFRKICQIKPDIVHVTYGPNTDYGGRIGEPLLLLFMCLKLIHVPVIVTLHSVWLPTDVETYAIELGYGKLIAKLARWYFTVFTRIFANLVSRVLLLVTAEGSDLTSIYSKAYGVAHEKIGEELHGCTFDPISSAEEKKARVELSLDENKKVILSFGFIRKDKGFEYLIHAFSRICHKDCMLVIVGCPRQKKDKEYLDSLIKLCRSLGINDNVMFVSRYLPYNELRLYIDAADVVVLPYVRNVGASGPLHHAISRGKPIIASSVGHMRFMKDIILLVSPRNTIELANAITEILSNKQLVEKVRANELYYAKKHDWRRITSLNLTLYRNFTNSFDKKK